MLWGAQKTEPAPQHGGVLATQVLPNGTILRRTKMSHSCDCAASADTSIGGSIFDPDRASPAKAEYDRGSLYTLALGTFAVGTEGFMIAAILPSIATSLGTSVQAAGQLVTIFALIYALSSPILTTL